jgi:serine/threonine-protein kinase
MADTMPPDEQVGALAEEYLARHRQGLKPSVESFAAAHPELADEIRRLFPALLMMEELKPTSGDATGSFDGTAVVVRGARLERLGDFRIFREVGRGGMGVVYEAEQESLGRRVALKVLTAHQLPNLAHVRRFEREARAAARLHHTNIVPVFGVGKQDGLHYYVMQFIHGLGLDGVINELTRLRSGATEDGHPKAISPDALTATAIAQSLMNDHFVLAPRTGDDPSELEPTGADDSGKPAVSSSSEVALASSGLSSVAHPDARYFRSVARIGLQVSRALEHAHSQGIFHRDVKPSNLLLDVQGTVWVADFGLAKAVEGEDLTHTGDIVGTIRYMAPERFRGRCDARADVYALGLTLYEMLALRPAFEQADRQVLMQQVMEEEPPRLRRLNPAVPRDLEMVVHKAIDKDPAGRYPTAATLAEDLERYLDGKPVRARAIGPLERCGKWARRRPAVASLLAGLVAAVIAGFTAVTWQWRTAVAARDEARRTLNTANEAVNTYFTQVSEEQLLNVPGMQLLRKKLLEQALPYYKEFASRSRDDPAMRADLAGAYLRWGDIASQVGAHEEAESALTEAVSRFTGLLRTRSSDVEARIGLARSLQVLAQQRIFGGRAELGRQAAEQAIASWEMVLAARPKDVGLRRMYGRCYDLISLSWLYSGAPKAGVPFSRKAIGVLTEVVKDAPEDTEANQRLAVALINLGNAHRSCGSLIEAEQDASRAVMHLESLFERDLANLALRGDLGRARGLRGTTRLEKGALHAAEEDLTELHRWAEKVVEDNPSLPDYRYNLANGALYLGTVHAAQGRMALAKTVLDEGFAQLQELLRRTATYKDANITLTEFYAALGSQEEECGRTGAALPLIEDALRLQAKLLRENPHSVLLTRDLFTTQLTSMRLDIHVGRMTAPERIDEIIQFAEGQRRQAEDDTQDIVARSEAVSGLTALAQRALASGARAEALVWVDKANTVLPSGLIAVPDLLIFRCHAVRLETIRGEIFRQMGKHVEAAAAARRAVGVARGLARDDSAYLFDLACAEALHARLDPSAPGPPEAAVHALQAAVEQGFDNAYKLEHDDQLVPLRPREDFQALIGLVKEQKEKPPTPTDRSQQARSRR